MTKNFLKFLFALILTATSCLFLSGCTPKSNTSTTIKEKPLPKGGEEINSKLKMKNEKLRNILFVIAPVGFQEIEYQTPRTFLENTGYTITVASKGVQTAQASSGKVVNVDQQLDEVKIDDFMAVVFVGGPGTTVYFNDQTALALAKEAFQKNKVIGAICIAPSILANAGILKDKKATSFPSEEANLKSKGAIFTGDSVTVDGKIITANGPSSADEFGQKIVEVLEKY